MYKYCAHYVLVLCVGLLPTRGPPEFKQAICSVHVQSWVWWQKTLPTLRGFFNILWATVPIMGSFLTFWEGTHSHSLKKQSPVNRLWWEQWPAGGPARCTSSLGPPWVAEWTRLTGKLPNGGWWSNTQPFTLGSLYNKETAPCFPFIGVKFFKLLTEIWIPRSPPQEHTAAAGALTIRQPSEDGTGAEELYQARSQEWENLGYSV